jgi:hypothetical protein
MDWVTNFHRRGRTTQEKNTAEPALPQTNAISAQELPEATALGLHEFLQLVLPSSGRYAIFQNFKNEFYDTLNELENALLARIHTQGLYYATASYGDEDRRTQANVLMLKAHRIDIDAGAKKYAKDPDGTYPTQRDAIAALAACVRAGLPRPSLVVSSGEGLHVYWSLDEAVEPTAWKPVARMLNAAGKAHGLKIDVVCTADEARVLRPVGSMHPNGHEVAVLRVTGDIYTHDAFAAALKAMLPEDAVFALTVPKRERTPSLNDDILAFKSAPASLARVAEHCGVVADMRNREGAVPEPVWRAVLGVAKYCEVDGELLAHEWSAGHPDYDAYKTQEKLDRWETPPPTCKYFSDLHSACGACKFNGKITTPKELGYTNAAPAQTNIKDVLPHWKKNSEGAKIKPVNTTDNIASLAQSQGITIQYNVMTRRTETLIPNMRSERDDYANAALARLGDCAVLAGMNRDGIKELVDAVAGANPYHPVAKWIESTPWDGHSRLQQFHETLELAESRHTELRGQLVDAWMLQAIGAIYELNGIAAPGVLVLSGAQGIGKTRWVINLCPVDNAVRTGFHLNPLDKDSVFQATSALITELGELDSTTRKSDVSALKAFTDRSEDVLRRPYAMVDNNYRRRTVFVGTVNGPGFLVDDTGDRRFWTIAVRSCHLLPQETMHQVWAEYRHKYRAGDRWHLDAATRTAINESNSVHRQIDPLHERILRHYDWSRVNTIGWELTAGSRWVSATEICIAAGVTQPNRGDATRAGSIVRTLNGGRSRRSNGANLLAVPPFSRGQ